MKFLQLNQSSLTTLIGLINFFSFANSSLIIIRSNEMGALYKKRLYSGLSGPDPFKSFNLENQQAVCDQVIMAKTYNHLPANKDIPEDDITNTTINLDTENFQRFAISVDWRVFLNYIPRKVHVGSGTRLTINMIQCIDKPVENGFVKWYVTYGLKEKQMFLIEEATQKLKKRFLKKPLSYLKITAIIEEKASFSPEDTLLQEYLDNCLKQDARETVLQDVRINLLENVSWPSLTINEHARLCSSAFEAINADHGYFQEHARSQNYVRSRFKYRLKTLIFGECFTNPINVVSCSINSAPALHQFYLLRDPFKNDSVFVFFGDSTKSDGVRLKGYIKNIQVLSDLDENSPGTSHNISTSNNP